MSDAAPSQSFETRLWVRLFLLFNLGPLPLAVLFATEALEREWAGAICAFWGALVGLTVGLLRTSLLRAIAGINVGAAAGMAWWNFVESSHANDLMSSFALAFAGAVLGMALNARRADLQDSLIHGAVSGFISFGMLGMLTFILGHCLPRVPEAFAWFIYGIPFMLGLGCFIWLIVDHGDPEIDGRPVVKKMKPVFNRRFARGMREHRAS